MRMYLWLPLPLLLGLVGRPAWAIGGGNCAPSCIVPPPLNCPEHCDPCAGRKNLNVFGPGYAQNLVAQLKDPENACLRAKAAKKLGCRLMADVCHDHGVLQALLDAILFDPCWEVRKEAIWALYFQHARFKDTYMVLYIAWTIDPHYMVRDAANEVAFNLMMCSRFCWQADLNTWGLLLKQLRRVGFRAGECDSPKLWDLALTSWKGEMEALAAKGISGKELPDVPMHRIPPPIIGGMPAVWQPPPPPPARAKWPVPHKCDDHHVPMPVATVPAGAMLPAVLPIATTPEVIPLPKKEAGKEGE